METSDLLLSLFKLVTPDGIQASNWDLFQGAIFGRDSLRVALDLLPWFPELSETAIMSLLHLQGTQWNDVTEEEPGRIHHEYRGRFNGSRKISSAQEQRMRELAQYWGGSDEEVVYYGSVDATPQLIRLITAHINTHNPDFLQVEYRHRDGSVRTVQQGIAAAMDWLEMRLAKSDLGLLEFQRSNPHGILWQVLRDGRLSYLHENGKVANAKAPIASLEVQALAYDAFLNAAELLENDVPEDATRWRALAHTLQQRTLNTFWMPKERSFAMAIDRDAHGKPRLVKTLSSLQAELLETRLFDSLPDNQRKIYVSAIINHMYSDEFLTDVGIRCRARQHHDLVPHWDYQGAKVSWTVMTNIFAIGLRRQGFLNLAEDMENRMLNGATIAKTWPEFYYVDVDGTVHYFPKEKQADVDTEASPVIPGTNIPEKLQAWTVSALLRISLSREKNDYALPTFLPTVWQTAIEEHLFAATPQAVLLTDEAHEAHTAAAQRHFYIDRQEGARLEQNFLSELLLRP